MDPSTPSDDPVIEPPGQARYSLEILSRITGVSAQSIMHYQEQGLLHSSDGGATDFDDETVRALRRIEHLRGTFGVDLGGLKLLTELLDEVERLREELRARR